MASVPAAKKAFCSAQGPVATVPLALLLQLVEVEFQVPAGASDDDILCVVERLGESGGGMAAGRREGPIELLPLPIAGLMSDRPVAEVAKKLEKMKELAARWGASLDNPFMALSFVALPVIPELKMTDRGLVEVSRFSHVPLFE